MDFSDGADVDTMRGRADFSARDVPGLVFFRRRPAADGSCRRHDEASGFFIGITPEGLAGLPNGVWVAGHTLIAFNDLFFEKRT